MFFISLTTRTSSNFITLLFAPIKAKNLDYVLRSKNWGSFLTNTDNIDDFIAEMAKFIIEENEQYIGKDLKDKAIEKVEEENTKEGGKADGKKKATRGRKKATA